MQRIIMIVAVVLFLYSCNNKETNNTTSIETSDSTNTISAITANNPIIKNKGANDPHIRIIDGKAYLSASHDKSVDAKEFEMDDWWLWSSDNLVDWELVTVLKPENTYIGKPYSGCWATDIVKRNNKYYWYFSERNKQSGVVVSDNIAGPWTDPLGKPLLSEEMTPTHEYDMGIIQDEAGEYYIVFGVWDYYIAKLNEDMISLAEKPRKITINNPKGPYNQDGLNKKKPTDDKPFIHLYNGKYYLSWGCFYAMADNVYGPYDYKASIIEQESFVDGLETPTWPNGFKQGRHGSFFEWNNQWYFTYCDISSSGNRYFRDTFISYIHYKENGEMSLIRIDSVGVGQYDATKGLIEAEDYYNAPKTIRKKEINNNGFVVADIDEEDFLTFDNIYGLNNKSKITINATNVKGATIEIRQDTPKGDLIVSCELTANEKGKYQFDFPAQKGVKNLCFVFKGTGEQLLEFDSFSFE